MHILVEMYQTDRTQLGAAARPFDEAANVRKSAVRARVRLLELDGPQLRRADHATELDAVPAQEEVLENRKKNGVVRFAFQSEELACEQFAPP